MFAWNAMIAAGFYLYSKVLEMDRYVKYNTRNGLMRSRWIFPLEVIFLRFSEILR